MARHGKRGERSGERKARVFSSLVRHAQHGFFISTWRSEKILSRATLSRPRSRSLLLEFLCFVYQYRNFVGANRSKAERDVSRDVLAFSSSSQSLIKIFYSFERLKKNNCTCCFEEVVSRINNSDGLGEK